MKPLKPVNLIAILLFVTFCLMFSAKLGGIEKLADIDLTWRVVLTPLIPFAAAFAYLLMQFLGYGSSDPKI